MAPGSRSPPPSAKQPKIRTGHVWPSCLPSGWLTFRFHPPARLPDQPNITPTDIMARKTVRIDILTGSPDEIIDLAEKISAQNTKAGKDSPIRTTLDYPAFDQRTAQAAELRKQAKELAEQSQTLNEQAATLIGNGPGQTGETRGTLLYDITQTRDQLLVSHRGNEQALGEYGFAVVVGTAATPGRRAKKA